MDIRIELHDGTALQTTVETFDAESVAAQLNVKESNCIAIGNIVVNRSVVRAVFEGTAKVI